MKNSQTLNHRLHHRCILVTIMFMVISGWISLSFADIYTWKDKNGSVHMTQTAPPKGATLLRHKSASHTPIKSNQGENQGLHGSVNANDQKKASGSNKSVTPPSMTKVETDDKGNTKAYWQMRKLLIETKKRIAEKKLVEVNEKLRVLLQGNYHNDDKLWLEAAKKRYEKLRDEAQRELEDLADELRRAGGPPGWLR